MRMRARWSIVSVSLAVSAIAGCRECQLHVSSPDGRACAAGADDGVDLAAEAADAEFDGRLGLDCAAVRRELACSDAAATRRADLEALAALRRELPGARASRAELVELLVAEDDTATRAVAGAMTCAPLEREIATRRFLAAHADRRPAAPAEVQP